MKRIEKESFPHPVLNHRDDVAGIFVPNFFVSSDRDFYYLEVAVNLSNRTLEELISNGKAAFIIQVQCGNTFFRERYKTAKFNDAFKIGADKLRDKVVVTFYICAVTWINEYQIEGAHSDYGDAKFDIEAGDILAYGGISEFIAKKEFDSLRAVSTIMTIRKGEHKHAIMKVDYDKDKIDIELSEDDYELYNGNKNVVRFEPIIHSSIVFPVLLQAIKYLKSGDFRECKWFQVLEERLKSESLKIDDEQEHIHIAQLLIGKPISRMLDSINNLNDEASDVNE